MRIKVSTPVISSPRVAQIAGMFDLKVTGETGQEWDITLPLSEQEDWSIGLITGPSGSGKSTIAKNLWPESYVHPEKDEIWPATAALVDGFPEKLPIKEVVELLSSIGFSSPPSWLKPYRVLSTGQKFRANLARHLAVALADPENKRPIVIDEFTSVVDRTVAQVGSAALARVVRKHNKQFVAVTCHEDIIEWLNPDWVYRVSEDHFAWRLLRPRPMVSLDIVRCRHAAWQAFAPHHYLSETLNLSAICFLASTTTGAPVVFSSWLRHFGGGPPAYREHRTVCLPDYQGIGLGNRVSDFCASLLRARGFRVHSTTTHPAMIRSRLKSHNWTMTRQPSFASANEGSLRHATTRLTASFRFIGAAAPQLLAKVLLETDT